MMYMQLLHNRLLKNKNLINDWFIDYILDNLNLRSDEAAILEKVIIEKLPQHLEKYWKEDGQIRRDLVSRSAEEWMQNELSFVAGFSLWFREKETKGEIDLSELISDATGEDVKASGKVEFDRERLELLHNIPMKTIKSLCRTDFYPSYTKR